MQLEPADSINPETNIVFPQCVQFLVQKVEWIWKFAEKTMNPLNRLLLFTMLLVGKLQKRCFSLCLTVRGKVHMALLHGHQDAEQRTEEGWAHGEVPIYV